MIGDHIRTLKDGRWTHAIDCGDETVMVLAEEPAQPPRVRRSYRPEFVAGADAVEVVRHRERTFPADEVVARAYSRVSDPALAAMFRDSEAFADWCTTGRLPPAAPNVALAVPRVAPPPATPSPALETNPASARKKSRGAGAAKGARKKASPARAAKGAGKVRPARKAKPARARAKGGRAKAAKRRGASRRR